MKKFSILFILIAVITSQLAAQQQTSSGIKLNTAVDSASYAIGMSIGTGMREQFKSFPGGVVNFNALAEAYIHTLKGETDVLLMNLEFAQAYVQSYLMDASVRDAEKAKEDEIRFLAENKNRKGIIITESGLQYNIETQGEGDKPTIADTVIIHYIGALLDGTVFQSSYDNVEPLTIAVDGLFNGLAEGLLMMPLGSKYVFWIPSELAYGMQGAPPKIGPNAMLIFEVELLEIIKGVGTN